MKILKLIIPLIFISTLFSFTLLGQTYSSITSNKEIYDFLNSVSRSQHRHSEEPPFTVKNISARIARWDSLNFIRNVDSNDLSYMLLYLYATPPHYAHEDANLNSLLNAKDKEYIFKQFLAIKDSCWHQPFQHSHLLKQKKQVRPNRHYYSIPLFSLDKNYAIVFEEYYCGSLCAYGGYHVYKKVENYKWKEITVVHSWMS